MFVPLLKARVPVPVEPPVEVKITFPVALIGALMVAVPALTKLTEGLVPESVNTPVPVKEQFVIPKLIPLAVGG